MPKQITTYEDDELGLSPGWDEGLDQNIREMRRHAKITERENREMSKRLELLERKDTFAAVGIPRDKRGEVFAQVYNGPADAESVQTYWEELFGPLDEEQEPAGTTGSTSEAPSGTPAGSASTAAERRIARAGAAGTTTGQSGTVDLGDKLRSMRGKSVAEIKQVLREAQEQGVLGKNEKQRIHFPEDD